MPPEQQERGQPTEDEDEEVEAEEATSTQPQPEEQLVQDTSLGANVGDHELLYFRAIEFEDCNFLENYIYIDLPWPEPSD